MDRIVSILRGIGSQLRSIGIIFMHAFRPRDVIAYPEVKPPVPPRYRGRIVLTRDPDGDERCVACNLCAVACPVGCISLQKAERAGRRPLVSGVLPHQFFALHLLRFL